MDLARTRALVLLVDDSPTQALRSAEALETAGFRVRLASNGREALEDALRWRSEGPPRPLLRGDELARELGIKPSPPVGVLLEMLLAAQYAGEITTREQALDLVRAGAVAAGQTPSPG